MNIDWNKAPKEAKWYCPETGLVHAAWFYKQHGLYYACFEGDNEWFECDEQENLKEWQWITRPSKIEYGLKEYKELLEKQLRLTVEEAPIYLSYAGQHAWLMGVHSTALYAIEMLPQEEE